MRLGVYVGDFGNFVHTTHDFNPFSGIIRDIAYA